MGASSGATAMAGIMAALPCPCPFSAGLAGSSGEATMVEESHARGGSVALVTGAGGGIGAAVAEALVAIGCRVVCAGRRLDRLEVTTRRLGPSAHALELDVVDPKSVD